MVMLLFAGAHGPLVKLSDCLREIHAHAKERRQKEIDERKAHGIPLDDDAKWPEVAGYSGLLAIACEQQDSESAREAAQNVIDATAGLLLPIGDLELPEGADDIFVSFRVISDSRRREMSGKESAAWSAVKTARDAGDATAIAAAVATVVDLRSEFVRETVHSIAGIDGKDAIDDELLDAFRRVGLLTPIYECALHFQDLPAKKALQFGVRPGSTSPSWNAASAQNIAGSNLAAMAARENLMVAGPISAEQITKQTNAPVDIS
jgi:hypothetical protein